jgi:hypothetical protein
MTSILQKALNACLYYMKNCYSVQFDKHVFPSPPEKSSTRKDLIDFP